VKIHIKLRPKERLSLCRIWPAENWVLKELAHEQTIDTLCKICDGVARKPVPPEKAKKASA
jgi:hypothetical protein